MQFQRPKAYDPTLAEKGLNSHLTQAVAYQPNPQPRAPSRHDFGFEDAPDSPSGGKAAVLEDQCRDLAQQLDRARAEVAELKASQEDASSNSSKVEQKIKSIQQVNRSQTSLMKAELQKTRRKLSHREAVCGRLRQQNDWLSQQMPSLALPAELNGLPTEDEAAEEAKQLLQMHNQWEKDLIQLQSDLQGGAPLASKSSTELAESQQRTLELEAETTRLKRELDSLRKNSAAVAGPTDDSASRKEVETVEEKLAQNAKKLKTLATAYKKMESEKATIEAKLKDAEKALDVARVDAAAKPKAPQRAPISPEVVGRVKTMMSSCRQQVQDLQVSVKEDLKNQFPVLVEESLKALMPELRKMTEAGCKEWKEKYEVECQRRRKLHNLVQELKGNIRVFVRVRPLAAHESGSCISFPSPDEITIRNEDQNNKKTWQFNEVFKENCTQEMLFAGVRDLVVSMIDGYNVCIFAYGQTGSGKTHSMQGTKEKPGIYPRTFSELFQVAKERAGWNIQLKVAIIEVYNDELRDLLAEPGPGDKKTKLQIKQGKEGNHVPGLTLAPVANAEEVDNLLSQGQKNRTVAATDMNLHSSRSHLLVQIHGSMRSPDGKQLSSAITLVDLAGSERLAKSGVEGDRAKEAIAINKSLSALGDVINARATKNGHTPFRNSTLTHLLQDSLSGDSKTLMLMQINPCKDYFDESQCSLQFGARVNAVEMKK